MGEKDIALILTFGNGTQLQSFGNIGGDIFQRVYSKVCIACKHLIFKLFGKVPFAAYERQRFIKDLVTPGSNLVKLHRYIRK